MDAIRHGGGSTEGLLTTAELANRPDFMLGDTLVSPSARKVRGPGGTADLEPRVMQVLAVLAEAAGRVVTRQTLFDRCWGSVFVGEDSLNRAISTVRRTMEEISGGQLEIETIPRTGYRLNGTVPRPCSKAGPAPDAPAGGRSVSRRTVAAAAALVAAGSAAGGTIWWRSSRSAEQRSAALMREGELLLGTRLRGTPEKAAKLLREAAAADPQSARAWGLLALALRDVAEETDPSEVSRAVLETKSAARRALAIDGKEPNARTALATIHPDFGNWGKTEDALNRVLADSPRCVPALSYQVMILQAVGRARESWVLNERALALDPLSPVMLFRRGLKLWIFGRVAEADVAADRALQLWPKHSAVWNARLFIFAFTGRPHAALAALNDEARRPPGFMPAAIGYWRSALRALDTRAPADVDAAIQTSMKAALTSPYFAAASMMVLSTLGRVDEAFAIPEGTLLRKGKLIGNISAGKKQMAVYDQYWRRTMNLFTPATAAMRADPRFEALCDGMGMSAYWRARGVAPDPMYKLTFV